MAFLRRTSVSDGAGKTGAARFTDTYSESSKVTGMDKITIPYDWLVFVSGFIRSMRRSQETNERAIEKHSQW
ncbi:MAG: hypothetical protein IPK53_03270 [bacterium]|nr:hypothetical protein [bacterium]